MGDVKRITSITVAGLFVLCAAGCLRTEPLRASTIQLGRALGTDNSIAAHATTFKPGEIVYVSVLTETPGSGVIVARWTFAGQPVTEETKKVSYSGAAATEFHFQSADGFKPGAYKVEILVDGQPAGERDFRVTEN